MSTSSTEIVGKKSAWQLWAETVKEQNDRGDELRKAGWFTINEFTKQTGWTRGKCAKLLRKSGLPTEMAYDEREGSQVRFYQPPPRKTTSRSRA